MVENVGRKVALILALVIGAIALLLYNPIRSGKPPFPLGLDIAGGERLLYRLDFAKARADGTIGNEPDADVLQQTIGVMRQRCDSAGQTEAVIRQVGTDRIEVSLPRLSNAAANIVAPLAEAMAAEGLPDIVLDLRPDSITLRNFPGSDGVIGIDAEHIVYRQRVGNRLTPKERGTDGTAQAEHKKGAVVRLISADEIKAALENLGDMRFLAVAKDADLSRLQTDQNAARQKLQDWLAKPENANGPISTYNALSPAQGGPPTGLAFYPHRVPEGQAVPALKDRNFELVALPSSDEETFSGANLARVTQAQDDTGYPAVGFEMNAEAKHRFGTFTERLVNERLAIVLNDEIVTAPNIKQPLYGSSIIEGHFSQTERDGMVTVLRSGSLKIKPELEARETVGASIGDDYVRKNLTAGYITLGVIIAFMVVYYRKLGVWASIALIANLLLLLGAMVVVHGTLTLAGIGGIVLTIGMAVDASILIFERIREEQDKGRKPMQAAKDGFEHAMSAIVDGNLTTLITAIILMWIGTGTIRGFAVTLTLGIFATMFSALVILRVLVHYQLKGGVVRFEMRQFFGDTKFKFMAKRKIALAVSLIVCVGGSLWFLAQDDHKKLGIDFLGGATVKVRTEQPIAVEELRKKIAAIPGVLSSAEVVDLPGKKDSTGRAREFRITFKTNPEQASKTGSEPERQFTQEVRQGLADVLQKGPVEVSIHEEGGSAHVRAGVYFEQEHTLEDVSKLVATAGLGDAPKVEFAPDRHDTFVIEGTLANPDPTAVTNSIVQAFDGKRDSGGHEFRLANPIPESNVIGAQVVGELRDSAIKALLVSSLLMLLYIRVRFAEYSYGWGALLADLHDVLATLAAVAFLVWVPFIQVEMNLTMIAAFLTILGYSINDTIVVYDRIRENLPRVKGSLSEICDLSVNQTLSRTIITSGTTIVASLIIMIFNYGTGNALEGFAFALTFGVVTGTYSSIYVASPIFIWLEERARRKVGDTQTAPKPPTQAIERTV